MVNRKIINGGGKTFYLLLYYLFLQYLPESNFRIRLIGRLSRKLRAWCCSHIFEYCGKNINVHQRAYFGNGSKIRLGDNSGLGRNCYVPNNLVVGDNVMMGPNCYILLQNHRTDDIKTPMIFQGMAEPKQTIIEDDVWIGRNVLMTPGRHIRKGSIIAGACVLCKDFPEYSVVGGNPSKLIKSRLPNNQTNM